MSVITIAIIVGISRYEHSSHFNDLDGAVSDARWFARMLRNRGLSESQIIFLSDEQATRQKILEAIRVRALDFSLGHPLKLIFYFAGHGTILSENGLTFSVLITYDTNPKDRLGSGLKIEDLVKALGRLELPEAYLFIDACFQKFQTLEIVIANQERFAAFSNIKRCFFCMLSAEGTPAYENTQKKRGLFTAALLDSIQDLSDKNDLSILAIAKQVEERLGETAIQIPTTILYGSSLASPFDNLGNETVPQLLRADNKVDRFFVRNFIFERLRTHYPYGLWVQGESGVGKTEIAKQLVTHHSDFFYTSIPTERDFDSFEDLANYIAPALADQALEVFPDGRPYNSSLVTIQKIGRSTQGAVVVIDHGERVSSHIISELENLIRSHGLQTIVFARPETRSPPSFGVIDCPRFKLDEVKELITILQSQTNAEIALVASEGNALKLRNLLSLSNASSEAISINDVASQTIVFSGGYVDADLFSKVVEIDLGYLHTMHAAGYITLEGHASIPHDSLVEKIRLDNLPKKDIRKLCIKSFQYWVKQCLLTPKSTHAARNLINQFHKISKINGLLQEIVFEDASIESSLVDKALVVAINELFGTRDWHSLHILSKYYSKSSFILVESATKLTTLLIEQGHNNLVYPLLNRLLSLEKDVKKCDIYLLHARCDWWNGEYDRCIEHAEMAINLSESNDQRCTAYLEKGIAYFFLGKWEDAKQALDTASEINERNPRITAWARAMLGTIDGLRGVDIERGCNLLESAILILESLGDYFGQAIALGNLAETRWKSGSLELAWGLLNQALKIAQQGGNYVNELEIKRNQLHVAIRKNGSKSMQAEELINALLQTDWGLHGKMELMQVYDTLATAFLYRKDIANATIYVSKSEQLTADNPEYSIYTKANKALLAVLKEQASVAIKEAEEAAKLAHQGDNFLAIRQLYGDALTIASLKPGRLADDVMKIFSF